MASHPMDVARLSERSTRIAAATFADFPSALVAPVLREMSPAGAAALLGALSPQRSAAIVGEMRPAEAADILRRLSPEQQQQCLSACHRSFRTLVSLRLGYPPATAGGVMDPDVPTVRDTATVAEARAARAGNRATAAVSIYVVGGGGILRGAVPLSRLLGSPEDLPVVELIEGHPVALSDTASLVGILNHPGWRDHHCLPVTNAAGKVLGVIDYPTLRLIEIEVGAQRRPSGIEQTATELAEFYSVGASALLQALLGRIGQGSGEARE